MFKLVLTPQAHKDLDTLEQNPALVKRCKAVKKALGYLQINPRHPALNTHKYTALKTASNVEVFEAYAENHTPAAYRIFWHYGEGKDRITILTITPHP